MVLRGQRQVSKKRLGSRDTYGVEELQVTDGVLVLGVAAAVDALARD